MSETTISDEPETIVDVTAPPTQDESPFLLHARMDIVSVLRDVARARTLVTVHFGTSREALLTPLLGVDTDAGELLFDCSGSEAMNASVRQMHKLLFYGLHDKVRIRFNTGAARQIKWEGRDSFAVKLPDSLLRLQRRELYRVPAPVTRPIRCVIPVEVNDRTRHIETRLHDISQGGVALVSQVGDYPFEPGMKFPNCRIVLPDAGNAVVMLEVVHVKEEKLLNDKTALKIGCKYVRPSMAALALVQKQMMRLERELKAK
jgi:c-di-GMP-binding flagellar brake protein YcgR